MGKILDTVGVAVLGAAFGVVETIENRRRERTEGTIRPSSPGMAYPPGSKFDAVHQLRTIALAHRGPGYANSMSPDLGQDRGSSLNVTKKDVELSLWGANDETSPDVTMTAVWQEGDGGPIAGQLTGSPSIVVERRLRGADGERRGMLRAFAEEDGTRFELLLVDAEGRFQPPRQLTRAEAEAEAGVFDPRRKDSMGLRTLEDLKRLSPEVRAHFDGLFVLAGMGTSSRPLRQASNDGFDERASRPREEAVRLG